MLSMKEAGIDLDIVEDGTTFEENALIKAKAVAAQCNDIVLADDSGLEIDYLNKEPGIYSARYAGEDTSYDIKNQMLLDRLQGVPMEKRTARFVCAIAAVDFQRTSCRAFYICILEVLCRTPDIADISWDHESCDIHRICD